MFSMNTLSQRVNALAFFRSAGNAVAPLPSLAQIVFPPFITCVASEITQAKQVPFDLVVLGLFAGIAVADQGKTRIRMPDGALSSLSTIMLVGAPSGAGKSRALEEVLAVLNEIEDEKIAKSQGIRKETSLKQEAMKARIQVLCKKFAKEGDPDVLKEAAQLEEALSHAAEPPFLLLNDVTAAAYTQTLVETGRACRIESDGIPLPSGCLRMVTKAWAGERSRRSRLTMPDGQVKAPFIVEALFTQPDFFAKAMDNEKARESGLLARTLAYRLADENNFYGYAHPMNEGVRHALRDKLIAIHDVIPPKNGGTSGYNVIAFDSEAEKYLFDYGRCVNDKKRFGCIFHKVEDFASRMVEHAVRIAGLLYLAEQAPSFSQPISADFLRVAINVVDVIVQHHLRWRVGDYVDFVRQCISDAMIFILEHNFEFISETSLKQALRQNYKAADVRIAVDLLIEEGHLLDVSPPCFGKAGRPAGRMLRNQYYELVV